MIVPGTRIKGCRVAIIDQNKIGRRWRLVGCAAEGFQTFQNVMQRVQLLAHRQVREVRKGRNHAGRWWNFGNNRILAGTPFLFRKPIRRRRSGSAVGPITICAVRVARTSKRGTARRTDRGKQLLAIETGDSLPRRPSRRAATKALRNENRSSTRMNATKEDAGEESAWQ